MIAEVTSNGKEWRYRFYLKLSPHHEIRKTKGKFKTEYEAQEAMKQYLVSLDIPNRNAILEEIYGAETCDLKILNDLFQEFMESEAKETRSESSRLRYYSVYKNHIVETSLGKESVDQITTTMVQTYLDEKRKTYAEEYVRGIYNLLLVIFHYAVSAGYIKETPMEGVKSPAISRDDKLAVFTDEQLSQLLDRLQSTSLVPAVMLGLHLGVKANECYAIRWSDIDFEKNTVKIDKQMQYVQERWSFLEFSSKSTYRTITFGEDLKTFLLELKDKQKQQRKAAGAFYIKDNIITDRRQKEPKVLYVNDLVNIKDDGEMLTPNSNKLISRITTSEFGYPFLYQNLATTHAVKLLESGCNAKYVQQRMGHAKMATTNNLYRFVKTDMDQIAGTVMNKMS